LSIETIRQYILFLGQFSKGTFPATAAYQLTPDQASSYVKSINERLKQEKAAMERANASRGRR
jgi:hypothetical protein